jgi:hypothetical protein
LFGFDHVYTSLKMFTNSLLSQDIGAQPQISTSYKEFNT